MFINSIPGTFFPLGSDLGRGEGILKSRREEMFVCFIRNKVFTGKMSFTLSKGAQPIASGKSVKKTMKTKRNLSGL